MLSYEHQAQADGFRFIVGIDEAGRGPLAGPVVASAVCLKTLDFDSTINDSKKMTPRARERAFHEIFDKAYVGIGIMNETAIDELNILNAAHRAMEAAVLALMHYLPGDITLAPDFKSQVLLLVDGNCFRAQLPFRHQTIIGGDGKSLSIACASIVAKVYRDRVMQGYDRVFPQYGFGQHKGYPTAAHSQAIRQHGPSIIHRRSFRLSESVAKLVR